MTEHSIWPPLIMLALYLLNLGMAIESHGKPKKEGTQNAWSNFIAVLLLLGLLHWGHFFDPLFNR